MPRKIFPSYSKPREDTLIVQNAEIITFEEIKDYEDGRTKNCFWIKTQKGNECLCVYWGKTNAQAGDLVNMKGRLTPDRTFIVWDLQHWRTKNDS